MTTETTRGVDKAIVIAVSVVSVLVVCDAVLLSLVVLWLRKHRAGNGEAQNSTEACELVVHPIVTGMETERATNGTNRAVWRIDQLMTLETTEACL